MLAKVRHWIHHLLNPHCPTCSLERQAALEESKFCKTCEVLQHQLEVANYRNEQIIKAVLSVPEPEQPIDTSNLTPIRPRFVPWRVRRQKLEELDHERAKKAKDAAAESNPE